MAIDDLHNQPTMSRTESYPGLIPSSSEIKKFVEASDIFTILLISGEVIHFKPEQGATFRNWLLLHNIEEILLKT